MNFVDGQHELLFFQLFLDHKDDVLFKNALIKTLIGTQVTELTLYCM